MASLDPSPEPSTQIDPPTTQEPQIQVSLHVVQEPVPVPEVKDQQPSTIIEASSPIEPNVSEEKTLSKDSNDDNAPSSPTNLPELQIDSAVAPLNVDVSTPAVSERTSLPSSSRDQPASEAASEGKLDHPVMARVSSKSESYRRVEQRPKSPSIDGSTPIKAKSPAGLSTPVLNTPVEADGKQFGSTLKFWQEFAKQDQAGHVFNVSRNTVSKSPNSGVFIKPALRHVDVRHTEVKVSASEPEFKKVVLKSVGKNSLATESTLPEFKQVVLRKVGDSASPKPSDGKAENPSPEEKATGMVEPKEEFLESFGKTVSEGRVPATRQRSDKLDPEPRVGRNKELPAAPSPSKIVADEQAISRSRQRSMSQPRIKKGDIPVIRGGPIQKAIHHSDDEEEGKEAETEDLEVKVDGRDRTRSDENKKVIASEVQSETKDGSLSPSPSARKKKLGVRRSASITLGKKAAAELHSSVESTGSEESSDMPRPSNVEVQKSPQEVQSVRETIIAEILQTEQDYIRNLDILVQKFSVPLKLDANNGLSQQQASGIFSNVEIILMFHKAFVAELKDKKGNVADIFYKYADFLKMYSEYLRNYDNALVILQGLKTNKKFQAFLQEKRKDAECKLPLTSYLIMPIQRVPRYELLLRELVKKTPSDSSEYDPLHQAYLKVQKVAQHINEIKRQVENASKLFEIQNKIQGKLQAPILAPERNLVKEGVFDVIRESLLRGVYTRRYVLFVFNDMILITTDSFDYKAMISMKHLVLLPWDTDTQLGIDIGTVVETIRFMFPTEQDRDSWLELLVKVKNKHCQISEDVLKRRKGSGKPFDPYEEAAENEEYEPSLFLSSGTFSGGLSRSRTQSKESKHQRVASDMPLQTYPEDAEVADVSRPSEIPMPELRSLKSDTK
jgi:hypothetical protein